MTTASAFNRFQFNTQYRTYVGNDHIANFDGKWQSVAFSSRSGSRPNHKRSTATKFITGSIKCSQFFGQRFSPLGIVSMLRLRVRAIPGFSLCVISRFIGRVVSLVIMQHINAAFLFGGNAGHGPILPHFELLNRGIA